MKQIQITLIDKSNKYKAMSTLIEVDSVEEYNLNKRKYLNKGIMNICCKRGINFEILKKEGTWDIKARLYDKEKIEQEKENRKKQYIINKMIEKAKAQKLASNE